MQQKSEVQTSIREYALRDMNCEVRAQLGDYTVEFIEKLARKQVLSLTKKTLRRSIA